MRSLLLACCLLGTLTIQAKQPNILFILADDMGYGDIGVNGCKDIPTPHIDAIAHSGINLTSGHVTHPYCSPSRAGIMSGRHQSSFGHDCNPQESHDDPTQGIPASVELLPARLKELGYTSTLIGKWHLGHSEAFQPLNRGFDHFFGFLGGGYNYFGKSKRANDPIYDDERIVSPSEITYLTTDFGKKAIEFISENKEKPWFCFLSYNAPHAPDQAPEDVIARFSHIKDPKRRIYAALVSALDDSIGEVTASLKEQNLLQDTLIIFLSDNGGRRNSANNGIYKGHKGRTYEGGIRVPFLVSWAGHLPSGLVYDQEVSSLDLYASIIEIAGGSDEGAHGINILPYLKSPEKEIPERSLYYRISGGWGYAVSNATYKLVKPGWKDEAELFHILDDPTESNDISSKKPTISQSLTKAYENWNKNNIDPLWGDPHLENVAREMSADRQRPRKKR